MPRAYTVKFEKVAVAAIQDLFAIIGGAGKIVRLTGFNLSDVDNTPPTAQMLALRASYLPATVTAGSGGSTPTPAPVDHGDAAATFTAAANNTTQATSSGKITLWEGGCHLYAGIDFDFDPPILVNPSTTAVIELITTPGASLTVSGTARCTEEG